MEAGCDMMEQEEKVDHLVDGRASLPGFHIRGRNPGQVVDSFRTSAHTCRYEVARLYSSLMMSQN